MKNKTNRTVSIKIAALIAAIVLFIGCTTFVISAVGVKVGAVFGARFQHQAELLGGVVLVLMGIKILVEHLMGG